MSKDARDVLNPLQKAAWIDIGTRAIHVHFNVYCPSLDLVSRVSVWFELSPYGRVVTSMPIYTTKLRKSNRSTKDMFVSVCEVMQILRRKTIHAHTEVHPSKQNAYRKLFEHTNAFICKTTHKSTRTITYILMYKYLFIFRHTDFHACTQTYKHRA